MSYPNFNSVTVKPFAKTNTVFTNITPSRIQTMKFAGWELLRIFFRGKRDELAMAELCQSYLKEKKIKVDGKEYCFISERDCVELYERRLPTADEKQNGAV